MTKPYLISLSFLLIAALVGLLLSACVGDNPNDTISKETDTSLNLAHDESQLSKGYMPLCSDQYVLPEEQRHDWQEIDASKEKAQLLLPPDWVHENDPIRLSGSSDYSGYLLSSYDVFQATTEHPGATYVPSGELLLGFAYLGNDKQSGETVLDYAKRVKRPLTSPHEQGEITLMGQVIGYDRNAGEFEYYVSNGNNAYMFYGGSSLLTDEVEGVSRLDERLSIVCTILSSIELLQRDPLPWPDSNRPL